MHDFLVNTLVPAAMAAVPGLVVAVFAYLKAHAAASPEKWDDEVVAAIEDIAHGVVDEREAAKANQ